MGPADPVEKAQVLGELIDTGIGQTHEIERVIRRSRRTLALAVITAGVVIAGLLTGWVGLHNYSARNREATLALGDVICEAQALTLNPPAVQRAREDFVRIPLAATPATEARALHDLQVLVAGAGRRTPNPARLIAAEKRYIAIVRALRGPSSCIEAKAHR